MPGWARTRYIREGADPAVRFLLHKVVTLRETSQAEIEADLGHDTIRTWRYRNNPSVDRLRRALNTLGYDLAVVDLETRELIGE